MEFEIRGEKYVIKPYLCSPSNKFPFYINITNVDDMYGISQRDFEDTYRFGKTSE